MASYNEMEVEEDQKQQPEGEAALTAWLNRFKICLSSKHTK